jgi:Na+/H+ antiporter NhaD/arsenite permease-like protein
MPDRSTSSVQPATAKRCIARLLAVIACMPMAAGAKDSASAHVTAIGGSLGWVVIALFAVAYTLVALEERIHLRKSKPVMLAAALIWGLIAWSAQGNLAQSTLVSAAFERMFLEYAELFFFLIVSMTYVDAMAERGVFDVLRAALVRRGLGYRTLFWITGVLAFALSTVLNNMTTALVVAAVVLAVGAGNVRFIAISCVNIVVAANAGGAWSAFGDITTLMVWQAHRAEFFEFFRLFLPALVDWLVPAILMTFALPAGKPSGADQAAKL